MHAAMNILDADFATGHSPDPVAPWPVDLVHLRRYTMGDRQLEREVLALFAGELPRTLASLRSAQTAREWTMAAHTLKGSARAVGAWRVARAALAAERSPACAAGAADRADLIAAIEAATAEAADYIASHSARE